LVSGCVALLGGTYQTADVVTTSATAVSYGTTGKGITDHIVSEITHKDCRMLNVLNKKNICRIHKTYEVHFYNGLKTTYIEETPIIIKEKTHESKLGTRHKRHAYKVRSKRSNPKIECKPPRRIFGIQDPFLARRTGRNETCGSNK